MNTRQRTLLTPLLASLLTVVACGGAADDAHFSPDVQITSEALSRADADAAMQAHPSASELRIEARDRRHDAEHDLEQAEDSIDLSETQSDTDDRTGLGDATFEYTEAATALDACELALDDCNLKLELCDSCVDTWLLLAGLACTGTCGQAAGACDLASQICNLAALPE